jgi:SAM-dependent methyltransferase
LRSVLRQALRGLGLLGPARRARDLVAAVKARKRNAAVRRQGAPDGLPLPPVRLVQLVTGTPDLEWFLLGGSWAVESIQGILAGAGVPASRVRAVLDFGCGCGRVTRHWAGRALEVHGCDYNRRLIAWADRHLPFARFQVNGLRPPLPYADASFDLVYALSVFTHLPEALQRPWMEELRRVLVPGGHLVVSLHGARYVDQLDASQRERFEAGELVVRGDGPGSNVLGAYHPEAYLRQTLARGFEVLTIVPEGARGNLPQDLVLLRRA